MSNEIHTSDTGAVNARLERLPYCSWHSKMRAIIGTAWFFDAFDLLAIAYVLPALIGAWALQPGQIGTLIAAGFAGQLVGSIVAGWSAERWGRVPTMIVTLLIFTIMSIACAMANDVDSLRAYRFLQGIGLGGEVPIMAAYVNEFAKAERRGRFSLGMQALFGFGLLAAGLVGLWVVPHLGWRWMFIIGAVPALLALPIRRVLPESPRWLASKGRFDEAHKVIADIERVAVKDGKTLPAMGAAVPPVVEVRTRIGDLFTGIYLRRTLTLWLLYICAYVVVYGLSTWAPSLFRTAYKLPLDTSLLYGFILSGSGLLGIFLCVFCIDTVGRRKLIAGCFLLGAIPLLLFAIGGERSALQVLLQVCAGYLFINAIALAMATYTAENYPNQLRAVGGGIAAAWQRAASIAGPLIIGVALPSLGPDSIFVMFGVACLIGAVICMLAAVETSGRVLEEVSPADGTELPRAAAAATATGRTVGTLH